MTASHPLGAVLAEAGLSQTGRGESGHGAQTGAVSRSPR